MSNKPILRPGLIFVFIFLLAVFLFSRALLTTGIVTAAAKTTGLRLSIESLKQDLLHSRIYLRNVTVFNPPDFGEEEILSNVREILVKYNLWCWLTGQPLLEYVRADIRELNVIRDKAGKLNIAGHTRDNAAGGYPELCAVLPAAHPAGDVIDSERGSAPAVPLVCAIDTAAGGNIGKRKVVIKRLEVLLGTARFIDYQTRDNAAPREIIFTAGRPCVFKNVGSLKYVFKTLLTRNLR